MAAFGLEQAEAILQPLAKGGLQRLPFRLTGHDSSVQARRVVDVAGLKRDVEVAHHHQGLPLRVLGIEVALQAGQPFELVGVFLRAQRGAIRHIEVEHPQSGDLGADHPLLLPQARSLRVIGQERRKTHPHILDRQTAEDRHAVVGLLAADRRFVAQGPEGRQGEELIGHLRFLQAEHLRPFRGQPGQHLLQARAHRVHIPGGDPHAQASHRALLN